ncbi:serine hydrolase [Candidatus Microgenomates bacterium]|nr:serine hydrolase [Candidatus Microgenomates bacterium]
MAVAKKRQKRFSQFWDFIIHTPVSRAYSLQLLPMFIALLLILLPLTLTSAQILAEHLSGSQDSVQLTRPGQTNIATNQHINIQPAVQELSRRDKLEKLITDFQKSQPAKVYVYVKDLKTDDTVEIGSTVSIPSGSIYKLFLANQVYKLNEAGKLNMFSTVTNTGLTFDHCTMRMVQFSWNYCGEQVRLHLGAVKQTAALVKQGYAETNLFYKDAAHTSASDVALILERIYKGGYYSKAHTAQFLSYLRNQYYRFRIPTGIPPDLLSSGKVVTYNKTGDVYAYANDGAIIEGEKTNFILVILSGPWSIVYPDSSYAIRHLTGLIYNFLNDTKHSLPY